MEEFSAILDFLLHYPTVLSNTSRRFSSLYSRSLGSYDEDLATILFGDEEDFVALLSCHQKTGQAIDDVFKRRATFPCLFAVFLFMGGTTIRGPVILLGVAEVVHWD